MATPEKNAFSVLQVVVLATAFVATASAGGVVAPWGGITSVLSGSPLAAGIISSGAISPALGLDTYAYPRYSFGYGVSDALTGDNKNQVESRDGGLVRGRYSLVEPDGNVRVVNYAADSVNGFNAVVSRTGLSAHPAPATARWGVSPVAAVARPAVVSAVSPLAAVARQGVIAAAAPVAAVSPLAAVAPAAAVDTVAYPRYAFRYGVSDALTGDNKSQTEVRDGSVVRGQYSLAESDGTVRVVNYAADGINGFNAVVNRVGASAHPATGISGLGVGVIPSAVKVIG